MVQPAGRGDDRRVDLAEQRLMIGIAPERSARADGRRAASGDGSTTPTSSAPATWAEQAGMNLAQVADADDGDTHRAQRGPPAVAAAAVAAFVLMLQEAEQVIDCRHEQVVGPQAARGRGPGRPSPDKSGDGLRPGRGWCRPKNRCASGRRC